MGASKEAEGFKSKTLKETEPEQLDCPFREFRDNELSPDYWGMGTSALRTVVASKSVIKQSADHIWKDDQIQPLPRSARQYLHGWVRAEELASSRWGDVELVISEENGYSKMAIVDMQLSHTQVLQRSSFCRRVLSACYILERLETMVVEHQWENLSISLPEGWRPKYHIYSPGIKPGGGTQHRPGMSKNGCYLVRLYYLGAWRCIWVSDQVPVDTMGSPLLPFSPLMSHAPSKLGPSGKPSAVAVISNVVHLWPLLLCKALLKLAAPDMNSGHDDELSVEDEPMPGLKIYHALTGAMEIDCLPFGKETLWERLTAEVTAFSWETDDDTLTVRSKNVKKPVTKDAAIVKRGSLAVLTIKETKDLPSYLLPGISPGHEMDLYISMIRDIPLKKPMTEPEVALWKRYRWVDWAREHGLYEDCECPRTRFIKITGFMKMSFAPHLLDVQSTDTIDKEFKNRDNQDKKGAAKEVPQKSPSAQLKEELREWILFDNIFVVTKYLTILYLPSMYEFTTAGNAPSVKVTKTPWNRALDIVAPKSEPLYLQIDGPDSSRLKISLSTLHPRVTLNCNSQVLDCIEPAYLILEHFEWFEDTELPIVKAYVCTREYDTVEVEFAPGRHYCRVWVHSRMHWHIAFLSESSLLLGTRDLIQAASVRECPWAYKFLSNLGTAFTNLLRGNRSFSNIGGDVDIYKSYQPDLTWNDEEVGYKKKLLHWMIRQALQSLLYRRLNPSEFQEVCIVLRRYLLDPDFGLPDKKTNTRIFRDIITSDPCDCVKSEETIDKNQEFEDMEATNQPARQVSDTVIQRLHSPPINPAVSKICELATNEFPCEILKDEREKIARQHEAATFLQSRWRGTRARKYLTEKVNITPDVMKCLMDSAFGNPEALSALMNEFFAMYPGAKSAYSLSSALSGNTGLKQYTGTAATSPKSKWIPYFQGVFTCHSPVKVHFDLQGTLQYHRVAVYDNNTGLLMNGVYRAHVTYDIKPNTDGYMVLGYGSLSKPLGTKIDVYWQLTILSSISDVFHICDSSDSEFCQEAPVSLMQINEVFLPNRRNILGGIKVFATQLDAIGFRASASSPDLDMIATLRVKSEDGTMEVVDQCKGKGVLFWPYIKILPHTASNQPPKSFSSHAQAFMSVSQVSSKKQRILSKKASGTRIKDVKGVPSFQTTLYSIELTCPEGWPLTLSQWRRVEEIRTMMESAKSDTKKIMFANVSGKQAEKDPARRAQSAREKATPPKPQVHIEPQPGDAYIDLECSLTFGRGTTAMRDDERELAFDAAVREWNAKEPGRNQRGAQIRKEFRDEYLEIATVPPTESFPSIAEESVFAENYGEYETKHSGQPTQVQLTTESGISEMSIESEEEAEYLEVPEQLKDKFIDMPFLSECLKEVSEEESIVVTEEMFEEAILERSLRLEAARKRMKDLQEYNMIHVLGRQKTRTMLLDKIFVDGSWTPELCEVLEKRDELFLKEGQTRTNVLTAKSRTKK